MLLFATLGAPERRHLLDGRRRRAAAPEPPPAPVVTGRATVISVAAPFAEVAAAHRWLDGAGEEALAGDLAVLNGALHAFRLAAADPHVHTVARSQLLVARIGYGEGEAVADGRWREARELTAPAPRRRRRKLLEPQPRFAAVLSRREQLLACEELALRARLDLDESRPREAALQLLVALDAALAEMAGDSEIAGRVAELRERREAVAAVAHAALARELRDEEREAVAASLSRLEAALRARAYTRA